MLIVTNQSLVSHHDGETYPLRPRRVSEVPDALGAALIEGGLAELAPRPKPGPTDAAVLPGAPESKGEPDSDTADSDSDADESGDQTEDKPRRRTRGTKS